MLCPICGGKRFYERKYDNNVHIIDFIDRTIISANKQYRKKYYICINCSFSLYGSYAAQIKKEIKYLEVIEFEGG